MGRREWLKYPFSVLLIINECNEHIVFGYLSVTPNPFQTLNATLHTLSNTPEQYMMESVHIHVTQSVIYQVDTS